MFLTVCTTKTVLPIKDCLPLLPIVYCQNLKFIFARGMAALRSVQPLLKTIHSTESFFSLDSTSCCGFTKFCTATSITGIQNIHNVVFILLSEFSKTVLLHGSNCKVSRTSTNVFIYLSNTMMEKLFRGTWKKWIHYGPKLKRILFQSICSLFISFL